MPVFAVMCVINFHAQRYVNALTFLIVVTTNSVEKKRIKKRRFDYFLLMKINV